MTKQRGETSKYQKMIADEVLSRQRKAHIAEAAVLYRLVLHDFEVFRPAFDGTAVDFLVMHKQRRTFRVQVKWASYARSRFGLPVISLECADGHARRRRYTEREFDFVIGYDLRTDTAYVFSSKEVQALKRMVTVRPDAAERWDKMKAPS